MRALRAFLYSEDSTGEWASEPFVEPQALSASIADALRRGGAALHVGFWRPNTPSVAALARQWPDWLLVSEGALGAFPPSSGVRVGRASVGACDGAPFRLVLAGFGYERDEPPIAAGTEELEIRDGNSGRPVDPGTLKGWARGLQIAAPDLAKLAFDGGVSDEETYIQREANLPRELRARLGLARFECIVGSKPTDTNVLPNLRACPPWLLDLPLLSLGMTVRQENVMRENSLTRVGQLAPLGEAGLLKLEKMGRGSVHGLGVLLYQALLLARGLESAVASQGWRLYEEAPEAGEPPPAAVPAAKNLSDGLRQALEGLPDKRSSILAARWGFGTEQKTLQEIGTEVGVTRERVRQIEARAYRQISILPLWSDLERRLSALLKDRESPLLLAGMHEIDPWFQGAGANVAALRELFRQLFDDRYGIFDVGGGVVVTELSQAEWDATLDDARAVLKARASELLEEDHAKTLVTSLLVKRGAELREELWAEASAKCLWAEAPGQPRRLSGFDKSAVDLVLAILRSSPCPLSVAELHRRAVAMGHGDYEEIYLRHACQTSAILYARSVYGLPEHCPLDAGQMSLVRGEAEELIFAGAPDRQWHASELLEAMQERGLGFDGMLNKYVLNLALRASPNLAYLQRMVWQQRKTASDGAASRLDSRQAVISVLEAAGRPLTYPEIRDRLMQGRGVNDHFQIHAAPPLIRVGPGTWGLIGRDNDDAASQPLIEKLVAELHASQAGIHIAELPEVLGAPILGDEMAATSLLSVARSAGVRVDRNRYAYLQAWKSSRRIGVSDAAMQAIRERPDGATIEEVCARVEELTRRSIPRATISSVLQGCDVQWDSATALWRVAAEEAAVQDEEGSLQ